MTKRAFAILCSVCGADTFVRREPVYVGFKKTGERILCVSCGHSYASEVEVPYKTSEHPAVFPAADRTPRVDIFRGDEKGRNCRHCRHYVVNPFVQRCGRRDVEVQATDLCDVFEERPDPSESGDRLGMRLRADG